MYSSLWAVYHSITLSRNPTFHTSLPSLTCILSVLHIFVTYLLTYSLLLFHHLPYFQVFPLSCSSSSSYTSHTNLPSYLSSLHIFFLTSIHLSYLFLTIQECLTLEPLIDQHLSPTGIVSLKDTASVHVAVNHLMSLNFNSVRTVHTYLVTSTCSSFLSLCLFALSWSSFIAIS